MMYLLTMGWFLAHTSLAMTPEHSAIKQASKGMLYIISKDPADHETKMGREI